MPFDYQPRRGQEYKPMDLNAMLITNKGMTSIMEMSGSSLESLGIFPKDWLIVDRSRKPQAESVVIALYEGKTLFRVFHKSLDGYRLLGDHLAPIKVDEDVQILGTITYSIRRLS